MPTAVLAKRLLSEEARALRTRLERLKPFSLTMPMVMAAAISPSAMDAIERHMTLARRNMNALVGWFLGWLSSSEGHRAAASEAQRRFALVRLRFNSILSQFEIFGDVLTHRSQHETGVWVAGLDDVAADALALPGYYQPPEVVCYVDRGHGAAIRRARTRLPGGEESPVAIIRVPRERMVGSGVASSLVHEVGHQAAALLDLPYSLRAVLRRTSSQAPNDFSWRYFDRTISEVIADFWSIARVGIAATIGLIAVVSLPRAFVFAIDLEDPHPFPWIRVKLSCAMGDALFPHPQWAALARAWEALYPLDGLDEPRRELIGQLQARIPSFARLLVDHRPKALRGRSLSEALAVEERQPARLSALFHVLQTTPSRLRDVRPTLAFAVIGQARADGLIAPEEESQLIGNLLTYWATRSALAFSASCAVLPSMRVRQFVN